MNELDFSYEATIKSWLRALEFREIQTEGRSLRLAEFSIAIGKKLGVEEDDLKHLRHSVLLHNIGKIGIPDSILNKSGPLSDEEKKMMELHPEIGRDMLAPIPFLQSASDVAYCHHEYWDGSGYPRGLQGKDIPLMARIVSVCNVWDALTSDQPYRKAWTEEEARIYIDLGSGYQFDPEIVDAFLQFIKEKMYH